MSLAARYTNQTARLEAYKGKDGFGKPTYSVAHTIKVRREPSKGVVRSPTGTDVGVETHYVTEANLTIQDKLDGLTIRRIETIVSFAGHTLHYEAWV